MIMELLLGAAVGYTVRKVITDNAEDLSHAYEKTKEYMNDMVDLLVARSGDDSDSDDGDD